MLNKEYLHQLVSDFIAQNDSLFLVSLKLGVSNKIEILIDSENSVSVDDCVSLTRHIESHFDRDEIDYSLTVSSAGLSEPFKVFQQYKKNVGKNVNVYLKEGKKLLGKMLSAEENIGITLETKKKEKKGKKKSEVIETYSFSFDQIDKTKIVISF